MGRPISHLASGVVVYLRHSYQTREAAQRRRAARPKSAVPRPRRETRALAAVCLDMLPWAATASPPSTPAAVSFAPPLRAAAPRPPPPLCRPLPRMLCAGLNPPPRAASSDGNVFWEEPDDGSGSDYEDDGPEQRRALRFPSSSPSSRLEAARQQEQDLRRGIGRFRITHKNSLLRCLWFTLFFLFGLPRNRASPNA